MYRKVTVRCVGRVELSDLFCRLPEVCREDSIRCAELIYEV